MPAPSTPVFLDVVIPELLGVFARLLLTAAVDHVLELPLLAMGVATLLTYPVVRLPAVVCADVAVGCIVAGWVIEPWCGGASGREVVRHRPCCLRACSGTWRGAELGIVVSTGGVAHSYTHSFPLLGLLRCVALAECHLLAEISMIVLHSIPLTSGVSARHHR